MLSIVIPARDEEEALLEVLRKAAALDLDHEVIVIDDGSRDRTAVIAEESGARVIRHPDPAGNGAAIKTGIRAARGDVIVFMDGDGQHDPAEIPALIEALDGYDMVVGARDLGTASGPGRRWANRFFNLFASYLAGRPIADLTSGFRATRRERVTPFLPLIPNSFSYTTTLTLSYIRAGFFVKYVPISASRRIGVSKVRPWIDALRFVAIILVTSTLHAPLRVFFPLSLLSFSLGTAYYFYTWMTARGVLGFSIVLWTTSVIILLLGLLSEQLARLSLERLRDPEKR
ncbi:MAG: glycosyltransferase family 2 protein [Planctomycetota bacterium]|nr:glycosyltransferase family 2 protein [Planctomycetota bacterium]